MKVCVVIAHPDDESYFMGGSLCKYRYLWDLSIVCLTQKIDSQRGKDLKNIAESYYGCKEIHYLGLSDNGPKSRLEINRNELNKILKAVDPDIIFTHNKQGEYGHIHHIQVNDFFLSHYDGKVDQNKVLVFGYKNKIPYRRFKIKMSRDDITHRINAMFAYGLETFHVERHETFCTLKETRDLVRLGMDLNGIAKYRKEIGPPKIVSGELI